VLLTGIHLMRTGEIEANLLKLNETAKLPYIDELVERKLAGSERGRLAAADVHFHERDYERLLGELESASETSTLPERPRNRDALSDLLVRLRLDQSPSYHEGSIHMKTHQNALLLVVQSRIKQLLARYEESESITHSTVTERPNRATDRRLKQGH
jgi:hypothetical protein